MAEHRPFLPFEVQTDGPTAVLRFLGAEVCLDEQAAALLAEPLAALADRLRHNTLLLDFDNVRYLGSGMLGTLINLRKKLAATNRRFGLCNLHDEVFEVFEVTHLTGFLGARHC
jgi:anti-anti-sigma factor